MLARWQTVEHPVADINREIGILAALYALEEVIVLTFGVGIEVDLIGADDRLEDFRGTCLHLATPAAVAYPALCSDELDARVARHTGHRHAIGVAVGNVVVLHGVEQAAFPVGAFALDFNRAGAFGVIGPLCGVEQVRAPVADNPARVVPESSGS